MAEEGWTKVPHAIARSTTLSPIAKLVWLAIASRANPEGVAWPSRQTVADETGVSKASVARALPELRSAGLLTWTQAIAKDGTPCGPNTYRVQGVSHTDTPLSQSDTPLSHTDTPGASQGDTGVSHTETLRRPIKEEPKKKTLAPAAATTQNDKFDEFWDAYPRKKDKGKARTAWTKALKRADADTIIAGAKAYAHTPVEDPKYLKYPQGWLTGERWTDEPDKPTAPEPLTPGSSAWNNNITQQRLQGASA